MKKKINKKLNKKGPRKAKRETFMPFTLGNINPEHGRILTLIIAIIFVITAMTMDQAVNKKEVEQVLAIPVAAKLSPLSIEIAQMVKGYPIENMMPYIAKQNPETAKFIVAIAKKESAWGKRRPVLAGKDCYNYWGFRLKSERMGSGGHTCFDSPEQAISVIAERIDELVAVEKIDNPTKMVIWKCGYACQNREKDASEIKWIEDVDYYYDKLLN